MLSIQDILIFTSLFNVKILFPGGSDGKASAYNAGDLGSIPGLGRSPGEGNGNSLQSSCLENPMDGGAQWATVHGVAKSRTGLSDFTFTFKVLSFFLLNFMFEYLRQLHHLKVKTSKKVLIREIMLVPLRLPPIGSYIHQLQIYCS